MNTTTTALGAGAVAFLAWFQFHYNIRKRVELDNDQSFFYRESTLHVITALVPETGLPLSFDHSDSDDLAPHVDKLHKAVESCGGKRIFTGRILGLATEASQRISTDFVEAARVILVTQWDCADDFISFRESAIRAEGSGWRDSYSTGFKRNRILNSLFPVLLGGKKTMSLIGLKENHDVRTASDKEHMKNSIKRPLQHGKNYYSYELTQEWAKLVRGSTAEQTAQPVLIWNWLLNSNRTKEEEDRDWAYGNLMMDMLSQNGGGVMDAGSALQLAGEPKHKWHAIVGVHYPDRGFVSDLVASKWMVNTLQGKVTGDTIAWITVPFSRTLKLKEPLLKFESEEAVRLSAVFSACNFDNEGEGNPKFKSQL